MKPEKLQQLKKLPYDANYLDSMMNDIMARNRGPVGRVAESSFFRIPAVESFKIELSEANELLKGTGLDRKLPSKKVVKLKESTDTHNQYMAHMITRMRHLLKQGKSEAY
jgi:hypothetical protein